MDRSGEVLPPYTGGDDIEPIDDLTTLANIVDDAISILKGNTDCRDLLTGRDGNALDKLKDLKTGDNVQIGEVPDGYTATWDGTRITVSTRFFLGSVNNHIYTARFGIIDTPVARAMVILHEVGHATRSPAANHFTDGKEDSDKTQLYDEAILRRCFGLKPKT